MGCQKVLYKRHHCYKSVASQHQFKGRLLASMSCHQLKENSIWPPGLEALILWVVINEHYISFFFPSRLCFSTHSPLLAFFTLACSQNSCLLIFFISTSALVFSYTVPCTRTDRGTGQSSRHERNAVFIRDKVCKSLFLPRLRALHLGSSDGSGPGSPPLPSHWSGAARWPWGRCPPDCWHWWWPPPPAERQKHDDQSSLHESSESLWKHSLQFIHSSEDVLRKWI